MDLNYKTGYKQAILWTDIETTGLDPQKDHILEIACVLTYQDLEPFAEYQAVVLPRGSATRDTLVAYAKDDADEYVLDMHTKNGLWEALAKEGRQFDAVYSELKRWLASNLEQSQTQKAPLLGGASVHFDRAFLSTQMPDVSSQFHYRNFDVSVLKNANAWWGRHHLPDVSAQGESYNHRAMSDIRFTLEEARAFIHIFNGDV